MPTYIALLRAVNVGGTGKLPMTELKARASKDERPLWDPLSF
jgi:uncharacterized protein (DUF1697 family)